MVALSVFVLSAIYETVHSTNWAISQFVCDIRHKLDTFSYNICVFDHFGQIFASLVVAVPLACVFRL